MAAKFVKWLTQGVVAVLDPAREERIERNTNVLHQEVAKLGRNFSIERSPASAHLAGGEFQEVKERLYRRVLTKAWSDEVVAPEERKTLTWLGESLQLTPQAVGKINGEFAKERFEAAFAEAMQDGSISAAEFDRLDRIAKSVNSTVPVLFRAYLAESKESIFTGLFASIIDDGVITEIEWNRLWTTASQLGVDREELLRILLPQAQGFVEHVLLDAKTDERLSAQEEALITWLLKSFRLPADFVGYVNQEVNYLRTLTDAAAGRLPSLAGVAGIELRAGEILHHCEDTTYRIVKHLKAGPRLESYVGTSFTTDSRFVFNSPAKSLSISLRSILQCAPESHGVEIRSSGKGAGKYLFHQNPQLAAIILRTAIGRANQTIVEQNGSLPGRHIARDVRQRVWQLYGGRCAECRSDQYLEYDHIIPHSKGGTNEEKNVQLLCRKCNLTKSDHI